MIRFLLVIVCFCAPISMFSQGKNIGMGGEDNTSSILDRIIKLEKQHDALNVYLNFAASTHAKDNDEEWRTGFANRELRLEILGNITDKLHYRFRHQLNKSNAASSKDNFAKATDLMIIGYNFSPKVEIQAGKLCQTWGGFEYDENPMFIYQYSDFVDRMNIFKAGVSFIYKPIESQEIVLQLTDDSNGLLKDEYGENAKVVIDNAFQTTAELKEAHHPLAFIVNWNGNMFNDKLQTRWSWGIQNESHHKYARMLMFGQQLNLSKLQWYVDYMISSESLDRLRIASDNAQPLFQNAGLDNAYLSDVRYNSLVTKLNWQFIPKWNLMVKGAYETVDVKSISQLRDYRKAYSYLASIEYYPIKHQNLRLFLSYIGKTVDFSTKSGLSDYSTNRIELGIMYRMKLL